MASGSRPSRTKRSASRSAETDLSSKFRTETLRKKFFEDWSTRNIWQMRSVDFKDFDPSILEALEFQQMKNLFEPIEVIYTEPTLLFYLHLKTYEDGNEKGIQTYVYGKKLRFSKEDLLEVCGGRPDGVKNVRDHMFEEFLMNLKPPYERSKDEVSMLLCGHTNMEHVKFVKDLCPRAKMLETMIRANLVPKMGDRTALTGTIKIVLFCILAHIPLSLPELLVDGMLDVCKKGKCVPFGQLVTRLLQYRGVNLSKAATFGPMKKPIDRLSFQDSSKRQAVATPERAPASPRGNNWEDLRASLSSIQGSLTRQDHKMNILGSFMKKLGGKMDLKPSKGLNRHFLGNASSSIPFVPNDDDFDSIEKEDDDEEDQEDDPMDAGDDEDDVEVGDDGDDGDEGDDDADA